MKASYKKYAELRDKFNMKDAQIADKCGIPRSMLSEWKKNYVENSDEPNGIGIQTLLKLSAEFNVPVNVFYEEGLNE